MTWQEQYAAWRDRFAQGMDPRLYTIEYLDELLLSGRAAIWFSDNSALTAEIRPFPTGALAVCGLVTAGQQDEIEHILIPAAERWGKANGCSFAMIESRPAWQKLMKKHGYEPFQVSLVKEL